MIRKKISELIKKSIKKLQKEGVFPDFQIPEIKIGSVDDRIGKQMYGDYSSAIAIRIRKEANMNPMEINSKLKKEIEKFNSKLKIELKEPGFINFFLSKEFLIEELKIILKEKNKYGSSNMGKGKTLVIDYSAPNIAKPFGIGHLRSTIIGQALYNIYKFLNWKCVGDNHLGDWGTQFGKLIVAIKRWGSEKELKILTINDLEGLYVKFHKEVEKDPGLEKEAREWFSKLEQGDKEAIKIWKLCVKVSLKEFDRIYRLLGIKIDFALGESFYQKMFKGIIKEATDKKIASKSEGALVIKYPNDELPPAMLLKSDGATIYLTRDLATIKYRMSHWKPELIVYEVGVDQALHLKQLFRAVELLGWAKKEKFFHVAHGLYRSKTGKFSTRRGETIHLEEVLKEAIERAEEIIKESETGRGLSENERKKIAKMVGIGAVKYNDLSQHYAKDIVFDWDKILNLKGNSCPYLQYTFARCQSVLKKAGLKINSQKIKAFDFNPEEEDILRTVYRFPEVILESAEKFSANLFSNFAFDLSQKYNLFYDKHQIIKAETPELKNFRLALTSATAQILKNSLKLMGISVPEKM